MSWHKWNDILSYYASCVFASIQWSNVDKVKTIFLSIFSEFLKLGINIIKYQFIQTRNLIFVVIVIMFQLLYHLAFFRYMSELVTFWEFKTKPCIQSMAYSQITLKAPILIWSLKLSRVESGQLLDGDSFQEHQVL